MKSKPFFLCSFFILFSFSNALFAGTDKTNLVSKGESKKYTTLWARVDSLDNKGLRRSAYDLSLEIYSLAKADDDAAQIVKAMIHRLKFKDYTEEDAMLKNLRDLEAETKQAGFPAKPLLHSMLGEMYWGYYQNNRYRFLNRSETLGMDETDPATWDLYKIVKTCQSHFDQSLIQIEDSKKTPVDVMNPVLIGIEKDQERKFRTSLFDFLAHRALDFYTNSESGLTRPAELFKMDSAVYLEDAEKFVKLKLTSPDTLDFKYKACLIFQKLISFHLNDSDPAELIDVEIRRLDFLRLAMTLNSKDSLYEKALLQLAEKNSSHNMAAELLYKVAELYEQKGNLYNPEISNAHKGDLLTAFHYCDSAINRYPGSQGSVMCENLKTRLQHPSISFITENVNPMGRPFRARIDYKNIQKIYCRIVYDSTESIPNEKRYNDDLIHHLLAAAVLKSWSVDLPVDPDMQNHSLEIAIPGLDYGKYYLLISDQEDFVFESSIYAYGSFRISDMSLLSSILEDGAYEFFVADRISGAPMNRVSVEVSSKGYNRSTNSYDTVIVANLLSDKNGRFEIAPSGDQGRNFNLKLKASNDELFLNEGFYQYNQRRRGSQISQRTTFFTDRAIYRPGQLIYFKALLSQSDGDKPSILPNTSTTIQFFDVNGQLISEQKLKSNEYGTVQGMFTAPQGVLNGMMRIQNSSGSIYINVEEYKRPRFESSFNPVKGTYRIGEKVEVSGIAKTYAGVGVDAATVRYRISRMANFPPWCYWYRSYFPQSPSQEILNGETLTDEAGNFSFSFIARGDETISKEYQPVYNFELIADVTDLNGETRTARSIVRASSVSTELSTDIPESVDAKADSQFKISAKNYSGESVNTNVRLNVYKLLEPERILRSRQWSRTDKQIYSYDEYVKKFPMDVYDREDDFLRWERGESLWNKELSTGEDSLVKFNSMEWEPGFYLLEGLALDSFGEPIKLLHYFTLYHSDSKAPTRNVISWIKVLKDDAKPGESDKILLSSALSNAYVLVRVLFKEKVISSEWKRFSKSQLILEFPVMEEYRGNFSVHLSMIKEGRVFQESVLLKVPWENKKIKAEYETFRTTLEPGKKEEWRIRLKDFQGGSVNAELLASMYDASLDAFKQNRWGTEFYNSYGAYFNSRNHGFSLTNSLYFSNRPFDLLPSPSRLYDQLNWFQYSLPGYFYQMRGARSDGTDYFIDGVSVRSSMEVTKGAVVLEEIQSVPSRGKGSANSPSAGIYQPDASEPGLKDSLENEQAESKESTISTRKNLQETAFFLPQLYAQEDSSFLISFNTPEALTRWKLQLFAHTKDLKYGFDEKEVITQKELMLVPNLPRFLRAGDTISVSTKINSLKEDTQDGISELHILDAFTMRELDTLFGNVSMSKTFSVSKVKSGSVSWDLIIPENIPAVVFRITAKSGNFSDGEEHVIPVLTNRQLVTESLPIWTRGNETKNYELKKLSQNTSGTLQHHKLKLEFSSNPVWTVVQALPYLMEYPYQCSEQIFSRYYANSIASSIANSSPRIKAVFENWKTFTPESFWSNLEKNQDLKSVVLAETPWVLEAKGEKERKERMAVLFDINRMSNEQADALSKLQKKQYPTGAWGWFDGMPADRYITQHIVCGLLQLKHLNIGAGSESRKTDDMIRKALAYLDKEIAQDYQRLISQKTDLEAYIPSSLQLQYLYLRSFSSVRNEVNPADKESKYFLSQAGKFWLKYNEYLQGMNAIAQFRYGNTSISTDILNSLKNNAIQSDELGMYWKNVRGGYYWTESAIETQSLLIEAFSEIGDDQRTIEDMKIWLLRQKQTQNWKSTKATVAACYALLLRGTDWLKQDNVVRISIGSKIIQTDDQGLNQESGTGNFSVSWNAEEINESMAKVQLSPAGKSEESSPNLSWGALYWQYFEDLDKITDAGTGALSLKKNLFVSRTGLRGPQIELINDSVKLNIGDKIVARITLRTDRDMEYLHLKDLRASGLEPENVLSQYKWQDGFGFYESTGDASTDFFISFLPKGTYVFEYTLRIAQSGAFSSGITSIQNMYAPEFSSHSFGGRIQILAK
ncbi:MAG: hypothetical protein EYC69_10095 [Bacteroidetes bacterium]|nr:MAG: hypothetical protein EYC69_10095 [Bacteroidota bacterium]